MHFRFFGFDLFRILFARFTLTRGEMKTKANISQLKEVEDGEKMTAKTNSNVKCTSCGLMCTNELK